MYHDVLSDSYYQCYWDFCCFVFVCRRFWLASAKTKELIRNCEIAAPNMLHVM